MIFSHPSICTQLFSKRNILGRLITCGSDFLIATTNALWSELEKGTCRTWENGNKIFHSAIQTPRSNLSYTQSSPYLSFHHVYLFPWKPIPWKPTEKLGRIEWHRYQMETFSQALLDIDCLLLNWVFFFNTL